MFIINYNVKVILGTKIHLLENSGNVYTLQNAIYFKTFSGSDSGQIENRENPVIPIYQKYTISLASKDPTLEGLK